MMRIKEAILRRKIIQQLNEEWREYEDELTTLLRRQDAQAQPSGELLSLLRVAQQMHLRKPATDASTSADGKTPSADTATATAAAKEPPKRRRAVSATSAPAFPVETPSVSTAIDEKPQSAVSRKTATASQPKGHALQAFVDELQAKLTVLQIFEKMVELEPRVPSLFYKSAFISCCQDRKEGRTNGVTISTTRDHAHILVQYIDTILQLMFEGKAEHEVPSPEQIGALHVRLYPLGLQRHMWQVLGESMAEVMFVQECVRAYPHAASAWSLLAVAFTDKIFSACKPTKEAFETSSEENAELPSPDSGCPYSNKSSMRDEQSPCEGPSTEELKMERPMGCRFVKLRPPPGLFVPTRLSHEARADLIPDRPLSPPVDYPLTTPERSPLLSCLQSKYSSPYRSEPQLDEASICLPARHESERIPRIVPRLHDIRRSIGNLNGRSVDQAPVLRGRSMNTNADSYLRRRAFQDSRTNFGSASPSPRTARSTFSSGSSEYASPPETFL